MIVAIQSVMPILIVVSHVGLVVLLVSLLTKNRFAYWVGKHALSLGLFAAAVAVAGSLFYSNVIGFPPCVLCLWQRIAIYPLLVLFIVAIRKGDRGVFEYVLPLSLIAFLLAAYHSYVQWGGNPLIPCDATASCSKLYVSAFGYVTIPTMSLTIALAMILLYFANRLHLSR